MIDVLYCLFYIVDILVNVFLIVIDWLMFYLFGGLILIVGDVCDEISCMV